MDLVQLIQAPLSASWGEAAKTALPEIAKLRLGAYWEKKLQVRVNGDTKDGAAPYAALIAAGQPSSGPYGGMSFVIFPSIAGPSLVSLVVGTNGLSPDEKVLGRPGHARKLAAIALTLNEGTKGYRAWAKHDPVRVDRDLPDTLRRQLLDQYGAAIEKYGSVIYAMYWPEEKESKRLSFAALSFLYLFAQEHGISPLKAYRDEYEDMKARWLARIMPVCDEDYVARLLDLRRFVVLEGPPGTGKTRLALKLLSGKFGGNGTSIQFHPTTTYETFVGGLAPAPSTGPAGLQFQAKPGALIEAATRAAAEPNRPYLLHIDEINRADLSKILGEAIFLLEPNEPDREVVLPLDFGPPFGRNLRIPTNLQIVGTMNSADRSVAIVDLAVRRRFAFYPVWPDRSVLESSHASDTMVEAFDRLLELFVDEAGDDAFLLMPGHAYFLGDAAATGMTIATGLLPLLREYVTQGYVAGFVDELRAYMEWLQGIQDL